MRGGPLHSKRIGYRFRRRSARLISPVARLAELKVEPEDIRAANLRAAIAEATELACVCGRDHDHRTGAPGCLLRDVERRHDDDKFVIEIPDGPRESQLIQVVTVGARREELEKEPEPEPSKLTKTLAFLAVVTYALTKLARWIWKLFTHEK